MIVNLSDDGARLYLEGELPQEFVLSIDTDAGEERKTCRLVWRLQNELGVCFTG